MKSRKFLQRAIPGALAGAMALASSAAVSAAQVRHPHKSHRGTGHITLMKDGLPKPELRSLNAGNTESATGHAIDIARYENLFQKYGVKLNITPMSSDTTEIAALLSGQVQVLLAAGVGGVYGSELTSTPLVSVFVGQTNLNDNLYSGKGITSAKQLIGKSIAVSSYSSVTYGEALIALKELHLTTSQVTITTVGNDSARRAALLAGSVGASLNDRAEYPQMHAAGMNVLVPLPKLKSANLPAQVVVFTKAFAKKYPNTVTDIVAALTEGQHLFLRHPSLAVKAMMAEQNVDQATAEQQVSYDHNGWRPDNGLPQKSWYTAAKFVYEQTDKALANVPVTAAYSTKFGDELRNIGWDQKMGIPQH